MIQLCGSGGARTVISMIDHEPTLQSGAGNNTQLKWAQLNNSRWEHVSGHF